MDQKKTTTSFFQRFFPTMSQSTRPNELTRNHSSSNEIIKKKTGSLNPLPPPSSPLPSPSSLLSNNVSPIVPLSIGGGRGIIDSQTYVDVQSNGLTKRIVRYDEEKKKASHIYNRAYKRPGDFPIVHLDKPKLTPKRNFANSPKMAKIGQPDPCMNRANVRAEILRNGTMMPPIPPIDRREDTDGGVRVDPLDALKEISRKRIHCEDAISPVQPSAVTEKDSTDSVTTVTSNQSKRQRIGSSLHSPSANSKCNEILSSLSSSSYMLSDASKRPKNSSPTNSISLPQPKRLQSDHVEVPTHETSSTLAISVPRAIETPALPVTVVEKVVDSTESTRPKLTLFNRPYTANSSRLPRANSDPDDDLNINFVKPRPMTARSRESVDNWLKVKPDDKRRLSLMLKYLSGEVDDGDAVDSAEKATEISKATELVKATEAASKPVSVLSATEKSSPVTVVATTQSNPLPPPSKPVVTFAPLATTTTAITLPVTTSTATTAAPSTPAVQERIGGFSFPLKTTSEAQPTVPAPISLPVTASSTTPLANVTPSSLLTSSSTVVSKDTLPTSTPTVSFTFQPPKPNPTPSSSSTVTSIEPTKPTSTFAFGSTTTESKTTPPFGAFTATGVSTDESKKPTFGVATTSATGSFEFGKVSAANTSTVAPTPVFGNLSSSSILTKPQPPSFGSVSTATANVQPLQSPATIAFGSALTTTSATPSAQPQVAVTKPVSAFAFGAPTTTSQGFGAPAQVPTKPTSSFAFGTTSTNAPNPATTSTFAFGAPANTPADAPKPTNSFAFGGTTSVSNAPTTSSTNSFSFAATNASADSAAFKNVQPAPSGFGSKTNNPSTVASTNIFGSSMPQQQQSATSIFGSNTNASLFTQALKTDEMKSPSQSATDSAKHIFGSSAKPSGAFAFGANSQPSANNVFGQNSATAGGNAFSFGASSQKTDTSSSSAASSAGSNASKPFSFGGSSQPKPVAFGAPSNNAPMTFGGANATDSAKSPGGFGISSSTSTPNIFSNKTTNEAPKVFSFGGGSTAPSTTGTSFGTSSSSAFGSPPAFGSTTFGSTNATPAFGASNTTPSFGTTATPAFGSTNATPAFGASNLAPTFGGINAKPAFGANPTPTFGGSSSGSANSSAFGGNVNSPSFTTSTGTAEANRTFNFTGGDATPSPVPNLFNIGPGTQAPRGRTIRTATRRTYR